MSSAVRRSTLAFMVATALSGSAIAGALISVVFGLICTAVALYQGYETEATPEGVAYATTRTVVISSLWVLSMDFVLTALMFSTP